MTRTDGRVLLAAVLLFAGVLEARAERIFDIHPAHSGAHFAVRDMTVSTVRGTMGKVTGTAYLDENDITRSRVEATIDATGIDTKEPKRDEHLRSPDFLDTAKYPTITVKSKKVIRLAEDRYQVVEDLTIKGVTREVTLDVEGRPAPVVDPFGDERMGGTLQAKINRHHFGVNFNKAMDNGGLLVGNEVNVTIDI